MKFLSSFLIFLFSLCTIWAQNIGNEISIEDPEFNDLYLEDNQTSWLTGKILNYNLLKDKGRTVTCTKVTPLGDFQEEEVVQIHEDGSFSLELNEPYPYQQVWVSIEDLFYAGVYVASDLRIELDAKILRLRKQKYFGSGITYKGKDGELNRYMNQNLLHMRTAKRKLGAEIYALGNNDNLAVDDFLRKQDSLFSKIRKLNDSFNHDNKSQYQHLVVNETKSEYYGDIIGWFIGKEMPLELFDKINLHRPLLTSNSGMGFYNSLYYYMLFKAQKDDPIIFSDYRNFSTLTLAEQTRMDSIEIIEANMENKIGYDTSSYKRLKRNLYGVLSDTILIERTRQQCRTFDKTFAQHKADVLKIRIKEKDIKQQGYVLNILSQSIKTQWCINVVNKQDKKNQKNLELINKTLSSSRKLENKMPFGKPLMEMDFGAQLYHSDTLGALQLLENLKTANLGKAIILDFWATWCAPCLAEMPYSKKLHDEVQDLPAQFVYLCTSSSSSEEKWKHKITELKLPGIHIFVEREVESELMKLFGLSGFPSYAFIDKEGKYVPGAIGRITHVDRDALLGLLK